MQIISQFRRISKYTFFGFKLDLKKKNTVFFQQY